MGQPVFENARVLVRVDRIFLLRHERESQRRVNGCKL
jgi:hypothetical protein